MNVLYVIAMYGNKYLAGVVHRELAQEFLKHGHSFSVFSVVSATELGAHPQDSVEDAVPVHRAIVAGKAPEDWINRVGQPIFKYNRFATALAALNRYLARHPEIDLILVEGAYPFGAVVAAAAYPLKKPFVVSVAGGDFIASDAAEYGYGRYRIARSMLRWVFRRAEHIRVTTPLVAEYVIQYGGQVEQIGIVPANLAAYSFIAPGENIDRFRSDARAKVQSEFGLNGPLFLCAGRLLPIKGFDDAVRALALIRAEFPGAQLVFVGPDRATSRGSYQKQLTALAAELCVQDRVRFIGAVEHETMKLWLGAADLLLVPSVLEGMNRTAVEAAAVGTPAIVTRTAGIGEQAAASGAGLVVEPHQPRAFADAALAILRDPELRAAMQTAGPPFAAQFSSARVGAQLVQLCERAHAQAARD